MFWTSTEAPEVLRGTDLEDKVPKTDVNRMLQGVNNDEVYVLLFKHSESVDIIP